MKKTLLILIMIISIPAYAGEPTVFKDGISLKKDGTSPNIDLHEGAEANDTYSNINWIGADGVLNSTMHCHATKGTTGAVHNHCSWRFSCGEGRLGNTASCGRIDTTFDTDFGKTEFSDLNVFIDEGKVFIRSPDRNIWSINVDEHGHLFTIDENP